MRSGTASIRLALAPSRGLRRVVILLALAAAVALHLSVLPDALIVLVPVLGWSAWRGCGRNLPLELALRADGSAERVEPGGVEHRVQALALHERAVVGVLVIEDAGRRKYLPWAADSLSRAQRRELRLWMRDHVQRPEAAVAANSHSNSTTSG